jgi:hypothetical protein
MDGSMDPIASRYPGALYAGLHYTLVVASPETLHGAQVGNSLAQRKTRTFTQVGHDQMIREIPASRGTETV